MRRILLLALLTGGFAVSAAARAGGGHSYSGGSSRSSYSGGSYSSSRSSYSGGSYGYRSRGPSLIDLYVAAVIAKPVVGIPLTLFLVWLAIKLMNSVEAGSRSGSRTRTVSVVADRAAWLEGLRRIRERDPGFDEREFLRRSGAAFLKIQEAWSAGDMAPARGFISDGVAERFGGQLRALAARGLRNTMADVQVKDLRLVGASTGAQFDALSVAVTAEATDLTVDANGARSPESVGRSEFEEVWTFLRRPGAKTLKTPGPVEGRCPSCGFALPIADAASCAACKSWVNSGEHDWVLAEITQSCEWSWRDPSRSVEGWADASAADPAMSLPALEDRASTMFWRWIEARRAGNTEALRAVAAPERLAGLAPSGSEALDDAAVGAVEAVAFDADGARRRAHVRIDWSAAGEVRTHYFVLERDAKAVTDPRQGLRTARCAACGGPTSGNWEAACAYCGAALADPRRAWTLAAVESRATWARRREPAPEAAPGKPAPLAFEAVRVPAAGLGWGSDLSPAAAFAALAGTMLADGEESLAERSFLDSYADSRGIPKDKAEAIVAAAKAGRLDAPVPENGTQAETLLRGMARMSLADGIVNQKERAALIAFAARFGLKPDDVSQIVGEERGSMTV